MSYSLIASESTVQVLSPTVVNDVVYCTIQTHPSGVIASIPIDAQLFLNQTISGELLAFAEAIELVMAEEGVVAGTGGQSIDPSGLLSDEVTFVVQYVPPGSTATAVTADAVVPVDYLRQPKTTTSGTGFAQAKAIIDATRAALEAAATG